jgi:hypothetical protein
MQLMRLCREIFNDYGLGHQLWLKPYRIVSTGSNTGVVQVSFFPSSPQDMLHVVLLLLCGYFHLCGPVLFPHPIV